MRRLLLPTSMDNVDENCSKNIMVSVGEKQNAVDDREKTVETGWCMSRDAKNENSLSQGENGVLTRIQKSSGYSPEA